MIQRQQTVRLLIDQIRDILDRLAPGGWKDLFARHSLDIQANDLVTEFLRPVNVDRTQPGFEDFSLDGACGIEPYRPAQSLLFHAMASPQVISYRDDQNTEIPLSAFPTFEEICTVENLVYGIKPPSIQELRVRAHNLPMAVVVFASEYRPALTTVHQKHADKCFSRVGISRVGTSEALYQGDARGYLPFNEHNNSSSRVLPCYFSAYIAVQAPGEAGNFGPIRFMKKTDEDVGDEARNFWVPVHKLFSGKECLRTLDLQIKLSTTHINEKIRKAHLALAGLGFDTGWHEPDIRNSPFVFKDGIAELVLFTSEGEGLLLPIVHESLVESANYKNEILTYNTPADTPPFRSSVYIRSKANGARSAPEYVHARHKLDEQHNMIDLNDMPDIVENVKKGNYQAIHYLDFTGDGCIEVECPALAFYLPEVKPAYSMVSAVDFFPLVKQYDLVQWWQQSVPEKLTKTIWPKNPGLPLSLADSRYPANLSLTTSKLDISDDNNPKKIFESGDDTISTVVGLYQSCAGRLTRIDSLKNERVSTLPDGASGIYAPGWDSSVDRTDEADPEDDGGPLQPGVTYFNNYGLGSPFPEDAMLCAALSSFWPAAAPDITRSFAPSGRYATATPLTDEIIGMNGRPSWNGVPPPKIISQGVAELQRIEYGDFVKSALNNTFDYSIISKITLVEYTAATVVMARVYGALGALETEDKKEWVVFSFKRSEVNDPERMAAEHATNISLNAHYSYRFELFKYKSIEPHPSDFRKKLVKFDKMEIFIADPQVVLQKNSNGWTPFRY